MQSLARYVASKKLGHRHLRGTVSHPDGWLLAHMAIAVCEMNHSQMQQLPSRDKCVVVVLEFIRDELWPLCAYVPEKIQRRSLFLGEGLFASDSWRKWARDLQALVLSERFIDGARPRRGKHADQQAKKIREAAERHLQDIIGVVKKREQNDGQYRPFRRALEQLQIELF